MSKHALDEMDTIGYFLPEESHFRLKKLQGHMEFLSQLAQPRTHDEEEANRGPQISGMELAVCLEVLAAQTEQVLDEVTWPAERKLGHEQSRARDEDDAEEALDEADEVLAAEAEDDAETDIAGVAMRDTDEADEASPVADADDADGPLVFGMTMEQLDKLILLHDRLRAFGDLVFGVERTDLAKGTLTMLGDAIFEVAGAARDLMVQVNSQPLPDAPRSRNRVREERAAYGLPAGQGLDFDAAMPMLQPPTDAGWRSQAATRH